MSSVVFFLIFLDLSFIFFFLPIITWFVMEFSGNPLVSLALLVLLFFFSLNFSLFFGLFYFLCFLGTVPIICTRVSLVFRIMQKLKNKIFKFNAVSIISFLFSYDMYLY